MSNARRLMTMAAASVLVMAAPAAGQLAAVDEALRPLVESGQLSGAVAVAMKDGRQVHASALGAKDLASGEPMRLDTIFRIFSMTKPVTAAAMMILWDEGKWKPEDPVSKFVPELRAVRVFKGLDPDGRPILASPATEPTMAQLMTHTAGFSYGFDAGYVDDQYRANPPGQAETGDEFARRLAVLPLAYEPGTQWQYSVAMDVQGLIIERLSGMPLAEFMEQRIFRPLGMVDTGFYVPQDKRDRLATLYTWTDGKLQPMAGGMFGSSYAAPPSFASGGGGLVSTAPDYARFGQMLLDGGTLDGARVLSPAAAKAIMTDHLPPALVRAGYGIGFQQLRPGYQFGYNGVVVTDPASAGVALGTGSYLWDGAAGTWFWIDPENRLVFVGMIQRLMAAGGMPQVQNISQRAVAASLR